MRRWRKNHPEYKKKQNKRTKLWRKNNPEKLKEYYERHKNKKREKYIRKTFGISTEQYDTLKKIQGPYCDLCGKPFGEGKAVLDHEHTTEFVRAFLHPVCNVVLGMFEDNPELFELAAEYLREFKEIQMFSAKDGKKFGSIYKQRRYDEAHTSDEKETKTPTQEHEDKETPEFEAGEQEGKTESEHENEESKDGKAVVAAHGKAHSVHVHHDHKNNKHKVVSHHEDGHMHEADYDTAADAHKHATDLGAADEGDLSQENQAAAPATNAGGDDIAGMLA